MTGWGVVARDDGVWSIEGEPIEDGQPIEIQTSLGPIVGTWQAPDGRRPTLHVEFGEDGKVVSQANLPLPWRGLRARLPDPERDQAPNLAELPEAAG